MLKNLFKILKQLQLMALGSIQVKKLSGKKNCGILVGNQTSGRNILTDLVDVENSSNAKRSLMYIKDELGINPEIIVHDLSPNFIKATCDIYGAEKMAFDPFHVMQNLNRAIGKDLSMFRETRFIMEKNELLALRKYISQLQKDFKKHHKLNRRIIEEIPKIDKNHANSFYCAEFTRQIFSLLQIEEPRIFFSQLQLLLSDCKMKKDLNFLAFALSIEEKLPKKRFTQKSHQRIIKYK